MEKRLGADFLIEHCGELLNGGKIWDINQRGGICVSRLSAFKIDADQLPAAGRILLVVYGVRGNQRHGMGRKFVLGFIDGCGAIAA